MRESPSTVDVPVGPPSPLLLPCFIQPHGALIALDSNGIVTHQSRNAPALLPGLGPLGHGLPYDLWDADGRLRHAIEQVLEGSADAQGDLPFAIELTLQDCTFDVSIHAFDQRVLMEFEQRAAGGGELAALNAISHRCMNRLKRLRNIDAILNEAVATLRQLTGFDRVTAYCFRHDDSSEVVAEVRSDALEGFAGSRFLSTDIPVQARALYILNTMRVIVDVEDRQVPIDAMATDTSHLDLSRSVLRSVSPVHLGYLKRLNVAACMTLSIVFDGRLWGVIACHHNTAHRLSYLQRMACDMLVQSVSSVILVAQEKAALMRRAQAAELRAQLVDVALHAVDVLEMFKPIGARLQQSMASDALLLMHRGRHTNEGLSQNGAVQLAGWLESQPDPVVALNELTCLPHDARSSLAPYCGLIAICFDRTRRGWLVLLRRAHGSTVTWNFFKKNDDAPDAPDAPVAQVEAGLQDKSLAVTRHAVKDLAVPWDEVDHSSAQMLADELGRACVLRNMEMEDAYVQLMGMLGHDLRDPLQTMSMVGRILSHDDPASLMGQRIATTTGRMQRLIAQVLDMSRLRSSNGLGITRVDCDMALMVRDWVDETRFAYPSVIIDADVPATLPVNVDGDRMAQVLSNLVSNARHHGVIGEPIRVELTSDGKELMLTVSNVAPPISAELIDTLFEPLKNTGARKTRNPSGLGLGLYIAREIAASHGGSLRYSHDGTHVVFTLRIAAAAARSPEAVRHSP
jgi:chemotaxis family two-component system sensor kinase Cph1